MKHFLIFFSLTAFLGNPVFAALLPLGNPSTQHRNMADRDAKTTVSVEMFSLFMAVKDGASPEEIRAYWQDLNDFTARLQKKKTRYKSEKTFLKYLFYKVHRKYLKSYQHQTTFYSLFEDGTYDCVTGTALYAMLLDALDMSYTIQEMPYHVFLIVQLSQTKDSVMLESTDPHGFVTNHETMADAIDIFREASFRETPPQEENIPVFDYGFSIEEDINLKKLAGLNYFNQAVDHYNQQRIEKAMQYLRQAMVLYPAKRMEAFQSLILQTAQKGSY